MSPTPRWLDTVLLGAAKLAVSAWVLRHGFTHISDDDYARTTIAESFVHAPRLDPSGTSWLPFPFYWTGAWMWIFGRTLVAARTSALCASALATMAAHRALLRVGLSRVAAAAAVLVAMSTPWAAWAGAAPVPEGFVGALVAVGLFACARGEGDDTAGADVLLGGALALLAASLSRYEAWPACAVFAATLIAREAKNARSGAGPGARAVRPHAVALGLVPLVGPLGWMAWNHHAHGSATHFLDRVAGYRHAIGGDAGSLAERLATYPRALVVEAWEIALLGAVGLIAFCMYRDVRARLGPPLIGASLTFVFLIVGELQGGAPTHHPVRALLSIFVVLAALGADGVRRWLAHRAWGRAKREAWAAALLAGGAFAFAMVEPPRLADAPGRSPDEDRRSQIQRGEALRAQGEGPIAVLPCAYEHFALIAALGEPERVTVESAPPRTGGDEISGTRPECPRVESR